MNTFVLFKNLMPQIKINRKELKERT